MKQVHKEYERAFLLEPTKLRRIVDTIHQRLADHTDTVPHDSFDVFLTGNQREVVTSIDAVLTIDNSRRHRINRLLINCSAKISAAPRPEHEVQVDFARPRPGSGNVTTKVVAIEVRSDASGWASRTLAEVEEQVERTWLSVTRPLVALVILLLGGLVLLASQFVTLQVPAARTQSMWLNESDIQRVQALLAPGRTLTETELREVMTLQLRNVVAQWNPPKPARTPSSRATLFFTLPLIVVMGCGFVLLTTCYPGSVFLWGDEVDRYSSALQRRKALWGIIISIAVVGMLSKFLFESVSGWLPSSR